MHPKRKHQTYSSFEAQIIGVRLKKKQTDPRKERERQKEGKVR